MGQIPDSFRMSLRAYAKHRGSNHVSVHRAIQMGRLKESVRRDGRNYLIDPDLADREWAANTDYSEAPKSVIERFPGGHPAAGSPAGPVAVIDEGRPPSATPDMSLVEANRLGAYWKAKQAELTYRTEAGELVEARTVERRLADYISRCKTRLLGIPSRARQQLPHLTLADIAALEALVRESLEELAQ